MAEQKPNSPIAHLMSGISWEGRTVNKKYRNGGRGVEEVLTTEVLLGLEFLPRRPFAKNLIESLSRDGQSGSFLADDEIDTLRFLNQPRGRHALRPDAPNHQAAIDVQIDAMAETTHSRIFIEAKRIRPSSFQEEQLARTFMIAMRESGDLRPKVLLILGHPPPVNVKNVGRVSVRDGILARLEEVYEKAEYIDFTLSDAKSRIDECVAWVTWQQISESVSASMTEYEMQDSSTFSAIERIASFVQESVRWHS